MGWYADDLLVFDDQIELAAYTTISARSCDFRDLMSASDALSVAEFVGKRSGRAVSHTLTAGFAARFEHGCASPGDDNFLETALGYAPHIPHLDFSAGFHATTAQDALVHVHADEGVGIAVYFIARALAAPGGRIDLILVSQVLQFAFAADITGSAVGRVIGQHQFQRQSAGGDSLFAFGLDFHPIPDLGHTGGLQEAPAFDIHHAHAAVAGRGEVFVIAQGWDFDVMFFGDIQNGLSRLRFDFLPVKGNIHCHKFTLFSSVIASPKGVAISGLFPRSHLEVT